VAKSPLQRKFNKSYRKAEPIYIRVRLSFSQRWNRRSSLLEKKSGRLQCCGKSTPWISWSPCPIRGILRP